MLSDVAAAQVARLRKTAGLTREQLAARCADLGWPALTVGVVGSIETGRPDETGRRRREVTVDELAILAAALNVPPLQLIYPLGAQRVVEMLPGRITDVWVAYRWAYGDLTRVGGHHRDWWGGRTDELDLHQRHTAAVDQFIRNLDDEHGDLAHRAAALKQLAEVREDMARRGWVLPSVPIDIHHELDAVQQMRRRQLGVPNGAPEDTK